MSRTLNVNPNEAEKFAQLAQDWWDPTGPCRTLHAINPTRLQWIQQYTALEHRHVLDIGCGGGLLSEAMAKAGARVTALDVNTQLIDVAKKHAAAENITIDYHAILLEEFAEGKNATYDVITCMELLEHVPDPAALIECCYTLLKPGGSLFLSTLNRTPKAFLGAIVAAEYLLKLLPQETHHYDQFIRPAELCAWLRHAGFTVCAIEGMHYNPFTHQARITNDIGINYLVFCQRALSD